MRSQGLTKRVVMSEPWATLLSKVERRDYRQGVMRLALYCSALGIAPPDVRSETLVGLCEALDAESMTKHPRKVIKHTIAMWNHFGRTIPGWPAATLASPFKTEPDTYSLDRFAPEFREDVARWVDRMRAGDPLDPDAPIRALSAPTIDGYVVMFRRFASALVRRGVAPLASITSLATFFESGNFKDGLRHFLPSDPNAPKPDTAYRIARQLARVARHYVKVAPAAQEEIDRIVKRLDPRRPRTMGQRNRDRLDQFDEAANVALLLAFPEAEMARALRKANPFRRAKGVERALAVSLLIYTGLRIKNLRHIRHADDIFRRNGSTRLKVAASEVKNREPLEFDLPAETVALLDAFLKEHRQNIPGHEGPYLFPGQDGGPKSDNAMRAAVTEPVKEHTGLRMSPHLYRHAIAKILMERDPSLGMAVSRHLGHRTVDTTLAAYLGAETRAASRRLNSLLRDARENPGLPGE